MTRNDVLQYAKDKYGTEPDYPWMELPDYAVLRHGDNGKWYGLIMRLEKKRLGLAGEERVDVLNLKCDPILIGSLRSVKGILPAYHMSKEHWITVLLDGTFSKEGLGDLIDLSYRLTARGSRSGKRGQGRKKQPDGAG